VLQTEGDLIAANVPVIRTKLREMVASGILHLTLDLAATKMVDSAGLGLLISAHNSIKKAGGALTVVHASRDILNLFQTLRMHQHFSVSGAEV